MLFLRKKKDRSVPVFILGRPRRSRATWQGLVEDVRTLVIAEPALYMAGIR